MDTTKFDIFIEWCRRETNIRTVILTSSRARNRTAGDVDVLSDWDIELYVRSTAFCSSSDDWLREFGVILVAWPLNPGETCLPGWVTRLVQFADGVRFDLQITSDLPAYHENFDAGYSVVIDKDGSCSGLPEANFSALSIRRPTREQFDDRINAFFWNILYVAKALRRDELFYARFMLDNIIRFSCLQVLVEWYLGITHGWDTMPNKYGRRFRELLDRESWSLLEATFAGAGMADNLQAMEAMFDAVRFFGSRICDSLGFHYPLEQELKIRSFTSGISRLPTL